MNSMLKKVFNAIASAPLGGSINLDACEKHENYIVIHCWNGKRFVLSCVSEPDGCKYDPKTGRAK